MQIIKSGKGHLAVAYLVQHRPISEAPAIGEVHPVDIQAFGLAQAMPWEMTELRQSTTVPNVSNTSAFMLASSGLKACRLGAVCWARSGAGSVDEIAATPALEASRTFRRLSMIQMVT